MDFALEGICVRIAEAQACCRPLRLRGAGTKDFYGEYHDGEVLPLAGYRGVSEYEPSELVITARCGTRLSEIESLLAEHRQCLAFEPPAFDGDPTIGGVIAAGLSGPQRVRAGAPEASPAGKAPSSLQPAAHLPAKTAVDPAKPVTGPEASAPQPVTQPKFPAPQSAVGPCGNPVDAAAYDRVVRWANANGVPVSLALGVAWMESRLNTNAPRGASGEVGMFQIMPERCRLEGWPPKRLGEPEFNAWLGTLLLARYYHEEGSVAGAAAKYVAGPGVFNRKYSKDTWAYINWYANTVNTYAGYFSRAQS